MLKAQSHHIKPFVCCVLDGTSYSHATMMHANDLCWWVSPMVDIPSQDSYVSVDSNCRPPPCQLCRPFLAEQPNPRLFALPRKAHEEKALLHLEAQVSPHFPGPEGENLAFVTSGTFGPDQSSPSACMFLA